MVRFRAVCERGHKGQGILARFERESTVWLQRKLQTGDFRDTCPGGCGPPPRFEIPTPQRSLYARHFSDASSSSVTHKPEPSGTV